ncbi:exocyst complex component EXO70H1-like [Henckelia pumila]|uniref:exocyst complex component EXO70H1-like n=1 Tax=Henckelia pumila TaxID=405737 RepID=UPI003C6E6A05
MLVDEIGYRPKMKSPVSSRPSSPLHSSHQHNSVSPSATPPRRRQNISETLMEEDIDKAEAIIKKLSLDFSDDHSFPSLFAGEDRTDATMFLEAVSSLQNAMHYYVKQSSSSDMLVRAQSLMLTAEKRLEKEFYTILSANRKVLDKESVLPQVSPPTSSSTSGFNEDDRVSGNFISASGVAMADLKNIADTMIGSGYGKECVRVYKIIRKSIVDETLYHLGVEYLNASQIQKMEWNVLEPKIKKWLHAVTVAIKDLFYGERILCDYVFSSSESISESCFTEISNDAAVNLFNFPEFVAKSKKNLSPEKIFRALDLYEAVTKLWPETESIFSHGSLSPVRSQAVAAQVKLGEAVRTMLNQFEAAIQKDSSRSASGGGVHPLTRYVMNFLVFIGDYSGAVADIVADWPVNVPTQLPESYFPSHTAAEDPSTAAITGRLAWLILVLLCKLDSKAALYNDVTLSYLFLANNLNYVVSKVRKSNLGALMGPEWVSNNGSKVKQYLSNYVKMGWSKATSALPQDPTAEISPEEAIECFRRFNLSFEEECTKQKSWVIPDPEFREDARIQVKRKIIPVYRVYYYKHRGGYMMESIIRYAPEDLDNCLSALFSASPDSSHTSSYETSRQSSPLR